MSPCLSRFPPCRPAGFSLASCISRSIRSGRATYLNRVGTGAGVAGGVIVLSMLTADCFGVVGAGVAGGVILIVPSAGATAFGGVMTTPRVKVIGMTL